MKGRHTTAVAVLAALATPAIWANDNTPVLLPAHGIYGLPDKISGSLGPLPPYINKDFISAIGYDTGAPTDAINWFRSETSRLFPAMVIDTVNPTNKSRTYAVSMQITRADEYSVNKPDGNVDVYLPLAVNVYFTNILTGEVLYSATHTRYMNLTLTQASYTSGKAAGDIQQAFRDNLKQLTTAVLEQAQHEFKPLQISATVVDSWKGDYILNKGVDAGIGVGDELVSVDGSGLKIIQSGKTYAVGVLTLGKIHTGDQLSFFSTASAADVKKPRVLILDADTPEDYPGAYASTQFSQSLGSQAAFTILPVNPNFQAVLNDAAMNQGLQQSEVTQQRALPNYYLRFKVLRPVMYELPSNHQFAKARVYRTLAFAELVDATGRVVYATQAENKILDPVIEGGMAFDPKDRYKVLYANLINDLSKQFASGVKFSSTSLSVTQATGKDVTVKDSLNVLTPNQSVRVYRTLKSIHGVNEPVLVPIWDAQVQTRNGTDVTAALVLPSGDTSQSLSVNANEDTVFVDGTGSVNASNVSFSLCDSSRDIGTIPVPAMSDVVYFSLGSNFKLPFFAGQYVVGGNHKNLPDALTQYANAGFAKPVLMPNLTTNKCIQPLVKVAETSRTCKGDGFCEVKLQVLSGIQVFQGQDKGMKKALGVEDVISNAPEKDIDTYVSYHALLKTIELMPQVISQADLNQF